MKGILSSYRWRRRLAWIGAGIALAVGIVVAAFALPKDSGRHYNLEPTGTEAAQTVANDVKQVRLTAADKRAVNRTLVPFVRSGVTRKDPSAAWDLVTPAMRSGVERKEWNAGVLPVQPFPATIPDNPTWNVLTSYPGDVTIDLFLQPRRGVKRGPIAFAVELKKAKQRWLVDSMIPEQSFAPAPSGGKSANGGGQEEQVSSRASGNRWLFIVPGSLLALIVIVPLVFLLNNWRKQRAIERRYRAERGL
ncbi:MAG: hypothetical protein ACJ76U_04735 [Gaiellaceae bacterium]